MEHFEHRGRTYRLFKVSASRKAPWKFQIKRAGKRFKQSLKTNDKASAVAKAKLILDADARDELHAMRALVTRRPSVACSPLASVIECFETMPLDIDDTHRDNCVYSLRSVLRVAGVDLDTANSAVLTEATARKFFEERIKAAKAAKAAGGQEDEARVKRSANSTFNQAICLFRPKVLAKYREAGLKLPELDKFTGVFKEEKFEGVSARYCPPSPRLIHKTLHDWSRLQDRNMFIAVGLALSCGLRADEIAQCTWGMLTHERNGTPILDGRGIVKNGSGRFVVPPVDPFWSVFVRRVDREGWRGKPEDLVLTGCPSDIEQNTFRNVGGWMRGLGWKTQKTNHALRAYAGSMVAMKFGIYRASAWLRHSTVKVTESHYTHFLNERVFRPENVRIRWAR